MIVDDYEMSELCEIFSAAPTVNHPNSQRNTAVVYFDQFPRQRLSPIDEADARYLYLFQKSKLLISKQKRLIDQLNNTVRTHEAFERKIVKKVETLSHSLQYHIKKDEMRKKLEYAIVNARIGGSGYICRPSNFELQFPRSARNADHCIIVYPHWLYIDLTEQLTLNRIQIYHYDQDKRVGTVTIQVSLDKANWNTVAYRVSGQKLMDIRLSGLHQVRYIRMQGKENIWGKHFAMHWMKLDWV